MINYNKPETKRKQTHPIIRGTKCKTIHSCTQNELFDMNSKWFRHPRMADTIMWLSRPLLAQWSSLAPSVFDSTVQKLNTTEIRYRLSEEGGNVSQRDVTWLVTSRLDTTRQVRRVERLERACRAVLFDKPLTSALSCNQSMNMNHVCRSEDYCSDATAHLPQSQLLWPCL